VRLDEQLPGLDEDGPTATPHPPEVVAFLTRVRDAVFAFVRQHGSYDVHPVRIRDSPAQYADELTSLGRIDSRKVPPERVARIVQRGYVRVCDGERVVVQRPRVNLAR
jgi:hypothetical protein